MKIAMPIKLLGEKTDRTTHLTDDSFTLIITTLILYLQCVSFSDQVITTKMYNGGCHTEKH